MIITETEFLQLIEKHKGILYKIARSYGATPDDQQDLFQEIILQTWKSLASFQGKSSFSTWMYRIGLNTAMVHYKKEKKHQSVDSPSEEFNPLEEAYNPEKDQQIELFYKAINHLDDVDKALILLLLEDKSGQEIAEILGISHANVRVKTSRAKEKLKTIIKRIENEL